MASELTIERVLTLVELVPRGRVVSYGDLGTIVGIGPRQVGSFMRHHSDGLPWWRITNASGDLPAPLLARARPHWADEGIVVKRNGLGCRITDYRADLDQVLLEQVADQDAAAEDECPGRSSPGRRVDHDA